MSVMYVILIAPMTALRIVLVHGVVIFPMMSVVSVMVTAQAVQTVLAYQMATAGKVIAAV